MLVLGHGRYLVERHPTALLPPGLSPAWDPPLAAVAGGQGHLACGQRATVGVIGVLRRPDSGVGAAGEASKSRLFGGNLRCELDETSTSEGYKHFRGRI